MNCCVLFSLLKVRRQSYIVGNIRDHDELCQLLNRVAFDFKALLPQLDNQLYGRQVRSTNFDRKYHLIHHLCEQTTSCPVDVASSVR
jgi:hypothetical protein